ncbi:unnamed protein product [Darwinula stevensoni]|uniref:Cytochrome b5 heme-binding domain-containing protein n=1 Tax=Darwinula stevensoni TaxID=69355 RepID=A0A7R9FRG8_9CRUS|nr:unnamed protein product [Darwinula stevensoni]CAG0901387.1 unnamed protein product [Darwinula stevensoni]
MGKCGTIGKVIVIAIPVLVGIAVYLHEQDPAYLAVLYQIPGMKELARSSHRVLSLRYWMGGGGMWKEMLEEQGMGVSDEDGDALLQDIVLTPEELALHDGRDERPIYLALLGRIYDVSAGRKHYGPGGSYAFFTGRDGSRAFVTGDFTDAGLTDEVSGLSVQDYRGLDEWSDFYDREYEYIGKVVGRFYDEKGKKTKYAKQVERWIGEAFSAKEAEDEEKKVMPPCNSEWKQGQRPRVWCSDKSGGISRDWAGVPRRLYNPGGETRCVCVKNFGPPTHRYAGVEHSEDRGDLDHPQLREYEDCDPASVSCLLPAS